VGVVRSERDVVWKGHSVDIVTAKRLVGRLKGPIAFVVPSDGGTFVDGTVRWLRERPQDPFTISESRAILHEAHVRALETLRQHEMPIEMLASCGIAIRETTIDGNRVINPVGFSGRTVAVTFSETFLSAGFAACFEEFRRAFARRMLRGYAVDEVALRTFLALRAEPTDAFVFLDAAFTVIMTLEGENVRSRKVLAVGEESANAALMRSLNLPSRNEAERLREEASDASKDPRVRRRVERALAPFAILWAQGVSAALSSLEKEAFRLTIVFTDRLLPPFLRMLTPTVFRKLSPRFRNAELSTISLGELLDLPETMDLLAIAASRRISAEEVLFLS
jgi:hypothetical protein